MATMTNTAITTADITDGAMIAASGKDTSLGAAGDGVCGDGGGGGDDAGRVGGGDGGGVVGGGAT